MSTDQTIAYSYCPGGTGKKIKFCCRDLLPELSSLQRMADGEQFAAALHHVDRLLAGGRERPCLLAWRGLILRNLERWDELAANAERFLAKYPDNRVALADMAIVLAGQGKATEALPLLFESLAKTDDVWEEQVFEAVLEVAKALCLRERWAPCRSLLLLALTLDEQNFFARQMLNRLRQAPFVPLLLKQTFQAPPCPADVPWKDDYNDLAEAIQDGRWCKTVDRFVQFAEQHPDCQSVAGLMIALWSAMGDAQRCREAADRFAAVAQSWEDAAEGLAVAMLLGKDPLGDSVDVLRAEWTVSDPEKFEQAMLEAPCVVCEPVDYRLYENDESPPPKAIYRLLERPPSGGEPTLDNTPLQLARIEYYGRQTDRPGRLSIQPLGAPTLAAVKEALLRIANGSLEPEPAAEVLGRASAGMLLFRAVMYCPNPISKQKVEELRLGHMRRLMLERWPDQPLGVLGGLTPRIAAADPAKQLLVQAAIKVLESFLLAEHPLDFNELRAALGLPLAPPVEGPVEGCPRIPLVRLQRVVPDGFSAEQLAELFALAVDNKAAPAGEKLAAAVLERSELENTHCANMALVLLTVSCHDRQQQMEYIRRGRATVSALGRSDYIWDLIELNTSFRGGDRARCDELLAHLIEEHIHEEGVQEQVESYFALFEYLRSLRQEKEQAAAEAPADPVQPKGLWMPGQDQGGGGKLWTPQE